MTLSDGPDGTVVGVEHGRHEDVALLKLGRGEGCAQNELQVAREEREDEDDGGGREPSINRSLFLERRAIHIALAQL